MNEPLDPEVPQPRHTPKRKLIHGREHILADEREWLARPASWGVRYLPASRQTRIGALFNHHYYSRIAEWISCPVCRPLVQEAFAEDGFRIPGALTVPQDHIDSRIGREEFRTWYSAQHPGGRCDAWQCLHSMNKCACGFITAEESANSLHDNLYELTDRLGREAARTAWERELALELVGPNPFRPITLDPSWLTSDSIALARTMYESRDFSATPILADALQDAGCENIEVLGHCRGLGSHVRGCWVVDLVLAKA